MNVSKSQKKRISPQEVFETTLRLDKDGDGNINPIEQAAISETIKQLPINSQKADALNLAIEELLSSRTIQDARLFKNEIPLSVIRDHYKTQQEAKKTKQT